MICRSPLPAALLAAAAAVLCAACTPALDWREVRQAGTGLNLLLPCRPVSQTRQVTLAHTPTAMTLTACTAGGATWGLMSTDGADPARTAAALAGLRAAAAETLVGSPPRQAAIDIKGATPHPDAGRVALTGRYPDGRSAQMEMALFVRGTTVFQASVIGERLDAVAVDNFFSSLRFP